MVTPINKESEALDSLCSYLNKLGKLRGLKFERMEVITPSNFHGQIVRGVVFYKDRPYYFQVKQGSQILHTIKNIMTALDKTLVYKSGELDDFMELVT